MPPSVRPLANSLRSSVLSGCCTQPALSPVISKHILFPIHLQNGGRILSTSSLRRKSVVRRRQRLQSMIMPAARPRPIPKTYGYARSAVAGAVIITIVLSGGLFAYCRSYFERVPITNRVRMLWYDADYDEEVGNVFENWLFSQKDKPRLSEDDPITKLVQEVLDQVLSVDVANGLTSKLHVFDDFSAPNAYAAPGGRLFINTGCLNSCASRDQIAGVLAHEVGHLIARHVVELHSSSYFASKIAQWFGFKGSLGSDLVTQRMQETEADVIGLMIMADAGFDPQARVDYIDEELAREKTYLQGRDPLVEFLSTHPTTENRLKMVISLLPEAKARYEKTHSIMKCQEDEMWIACRTELSRRVEAFNGLLHLAEQMRPDVLLSKVEQRMQMIESMLNTLHDAIQRDKATDVVMEPSPDENLDVANCREKIDVSMEAIGDAHQRPRFTENPIASTSTVESPTTKEKGTKEKPNIESSQKPDAIVEERNSE